MESHVGPIDIAIAKALASNSSITCLKLVNLDNLQAIDVDGALASTLARITSLQRLDASSI